MRVGEKGKFNILVNSDSFFASITIILEIKYNIDPEFGFMRWLTPSQLIPSQSSLAPVQYLQKIQMGSKSMLD